ncbi:hypothetical protein HPB50_006440 [Hyalomma asiaticum]|uniref:Uncharacterized protein n=1 Tax=Hyalomma asiaticum TaxID=266040 RepID=A0ACB7S722_HYAAI|nr:hypothetical protein HPB50_006440 [Hyalomma asiaticum]
MDLHHGGLLLDLPGCKFPKYSTFHWTMRLVSLLDSSTTQMCSKPAVVYLSGSSIMLNRRLLRERYGLTADQLVCTSREIMRSTGVSIPDAHYFKAPPRQVTFGKALSEEYVEVSCGTNSTILFKEYFMIPLNKSKDQYLKPGQLSVLVLGLDSTSRLNFNRRLTKTRRYLMTELKAFEFLGYNKVGENSFPNQMPLLTGMSGPNVLSIYHEAYFDSLPHLWRAYKTRGYTTLFVEEMAYAGLFTFPDLKGFASPPADYYPRPFILALDTEVKHAPALCAGSRLKSGVFLDYVRNVLSAVSKSFAYVWISDIPHENHTSLSTLDDPLEGFLRDLTSVGLLERTALLFLSDHGVRYGSIRMTEAGRHEDLTPFAFLALPAWFLREHPDAAVHLETNQRRLITAYDFHATLLSLADLPSLRARPMLKGLSLLGPVPPQRSCSDAFVPKHFCACLGSRGRVNNAAQANALGHFSVTYMNVQAGLHFPHLCHMWSLASVDEAEVLGGEVAGKVLFRLRLTTTPTAHFEIYGTIRNSTREARRVIFIQRLDKYGNETTCLPLSRWQHLCKCK